MMLLIFGYLGHSVHKIDGVGKVVELESPLDVLLLQLPLGDLFHALFQLGRLHQISHNRTTSNTRKLFCNDESSLFFGAPCLMNPALSLLSSRVAKTTRDLSIGNQLRRFGSVTLNIENTTCWEAVGWTALPDGN